MIENQSINLINKKSLKEFRKLKGILPNSAKIIYLTEKKKELAWEEGKTPLTRKNND